MSDPQAWEDVAGEVAAAAALAVAPAVRKAADDLYERLLDGVQDYLADNVTFNIASRLDAAERGRRSEWERAERAEATTRDLLVALKDSAEGWANAVELKIVAPQHVGSAAILRDKALAALAKAQGVQS